MMKPLAYVGVVALGVSCLTASSAHAQLLPPADVPATSPATTATATDRSPRSWLASPPSKPVVATAESPEIPWKSAVLLLGVAAIGVFAWRHRNRFRSVAEGKVGARLSVAGSVRVGPKAHLVLANVGDRALLLGVTDDSVRRIAWIDQPAETPPKLLSSSPPAKKAQAETAVKSVGREVLKAAAASPATKASPAPSSPKTPIIDARPRNFLEAMRAANERVERSERAERTERIERAERVERAEREERPSEPPPDIEVAPSPYADSRLAELDSMPDTRDSRPPPLESTPPPLESMPPPLESSPPPRATTSAVLDSTPPPSTGARSLPNAALEIAGTATDSVEWSRPATPRKRRSTIPKVKAAPLAEAPRPAEPPPEPPKSAPIEETVQSNAESAPRPGLVATPIEIAKPLVFTDVVRPVQRNDVLDQDAVEGQAAGVLSRKVRRRV
jgi:flagellar biogenesis protein FliO